MSSDRFQDLIALKPDSDVKVAPLQTEVANHWSAPVRPDKTGSIEPVELDSVPEAKRTYFGKIKDEVTPPVIAAISGVALYKGMDLAEKRFGPGAELFAKKIAGVDVVAHETDLNAAKFMALPIAAAATYAFSRDFQSLKHSTSISDTLKDSGALVADSLTILGAVSTFVPKVRLFSTAMQFAGLASRTFLGNLNQESNSSKELE